MAVVDGLDVIECLCNCERGVVVVVDVSIKKKFPTQLGITSFSLFVRTGWTSDGGFHAAWTRGPSLNQ